MKSDWLNGAALLLALVLSAWGSLRQASESSHGQTLVLTEVLESRLEEDRLLDARGVEVDVGPYKRIVSLNTIADHLLLDLVEPDRLVGITHYTKSGHADAWRFGDRDPATHGMRTSAMKMSSRALASFSSSALANGPRPATTPRAHRG